MNWTWLTKYVRPARATALARQVLDDARPLVAQVIPTGPVIDPPAGNLPTIKSGSRLGLRAATISVTPSSRWISVPRRLLRNLEEPTAARVEVQEDRVVITFYRHPAHGLLHVSKEGRITGTGVLAERFPTPGLTRYRTTLRGHVLTLHLDRVIAATPAA